MKPWLCRLLHFGHRMRVVDACVEKGMVIKTYTEDGEHVEPDAYFVKVSFKCCNCSYEFHADGPAELRDSDTFSRIWRIGT